MLNTDSMAEISIFDVHLGDILILNDMFKLSKFAFDPHKICKYLCQKDINFCAAKPKVRVLVQGNTLLWEDQSLRLSCDVFNLEGPVTSYKWYKDGIIIDG
uniref:Ig-like domain-containing protein n=1 Tax=Romanomermis culicivorax TaxID=13658 RepID=A0A915KRF4_ROMCU